MRAYIGRRVLQMLPVLLLASVAIWVLIYLIPSGPANAIGGEFASPEQIEQIKKNLGLDKPLWEQYIRWLGNVLHGDLGTSYASNTPVAELLVSRIPATVQLAVLSMAIGFLLAIPIGVIAAVRSDSWPGRVARTYQTVGLAIPTFWLGILLILFLALKLHWLPGVSTYVPIWEDPMGMLRNTLVPALAIGIHVSAILSRFVGASMGQMLETSFVRTARSKGVIERKVLARHALRNAMIPTVTIAGIQLGEFLAGTVVIEVVVNYPGLGRLLFTAIDGRDYAVVQGTILFVVATFLVLNLLVDVLYAALDPRVQLLSRS